LPAASRAHALRPYPGKNLRRVQPAQAATALQIRDDAGAQTIVFGGLGQSMSAKGWTMTVAAVAVAAGTYFTLDTIYPPQQEKVQGPQLAPVDAVFSRSLQQDGAAAPIAAPRAAPGAASLAASAESDYAGGDSEDLAGAAPEEAWETEPENEPAYEMEPEPLPVATPTPRPTAAPTAAPAPRPAATPAPARSAAAPTAAPAQRVTQWWGPESRDRLSVVYAGSAAYTRAIVLMFNGPFADAAAVQRHLRVTDASGKAVAGTWEIGASNRRMLLFPVSRAGNFTVSVGADLTDSNGRRLGSELKGPVRVQ
jgi:hypothetical protein